MYLDNAASTKMHPVVIKSMQGISYANYNSKYYKEAKEIKKTINQAIDEIAINLKINKERMVFTSGATESNNYIIKGIYNKYSNAHFITSTTEHKSVLMVFKYIESLGANVSFINPDKNGVITKAIIEASVQDDTKFISIMSVNNETGIINEVEDINDYCHKKEILFHTDATQALGKVKINYDQFDYVSFSSHKIFGPKGIGLAIISDKCNIVPLLHGSEQQNNHRSGTLPNELIVGFSSAINLAITNINNNIKKITKSKEIILKQLKESFGEDLVINFPKNTVNNIISIQIKGEINNIILENNKDIIGASTGSSCSITQPSYVLKACGFTQQEIRTTIRLSLSPYDEINL